MLAEPFRRCVSLAQEDQWKNRTEKVVSGLVLLDHTQRNSDLDLTFSLPECRALQFDLWSSGRPAHQGLRRLWRGQQATRQDVSIQCFK